MCCVALVMLQFSFKKNELVIERFPPPELHIFTGIFNHIYDAMMADPELSSFVDAWSKDVGVTRRFCPGHAFVGNHCERLLKKIDVLIAKRPPRTIHKEQLAWQSEFKAPLDSKSSTRYLQDNPRRPHDGPRSPQEDP